jgi:hypothetical protein
MVLVLMLYDGLLWAVGAEFGGCHSVLLDPNWMQRPGWWSEDACCCWLRHEDEIEKNPKLEFQAMTGDQKCE